MVLCESGKFKDARSAMCRQCYKHLQYGLAMNRKEREQEEQLARMRFDFREMAEVVEHNCIGTTDGHSITFAGKVGDVS